MRIEDTPVGAAGANAVEQAARSGVKRGPEPPKIEDRDVVEISGLSTSLSAEADREERIQQLQLAVQAGRYHPPTGEVAGRIVDEMLSQRK